MLESKLTEYIMYAISLACAFILVFLLGINVVRDDYNKMIKVKESEIERVTQQRDIYKKRWEIRDKAATHFYDEYLHLKEKYDALTIDKEDGANE